MREVIVTERDVERSLRSLMEAVYALLDCQPITRAPRTVSAFQALDAALDHAQATLDARKPKP